MHFLCKIGFHKYNVPDYNNTLQIDRKCQRQDCGKEQHQKATGSMCWGWVDGPRPPKPSFLPSPQR